MNINALRFYNLCEGDNGVGPLAGCVFEIVGENGYRATVTSGSTPEVLLPSDITNGSYTIREISVPDGYMRDTVFERSFVVNGNKFQGENNIGTFINHDLRQMESGKTAEVEDYNNRIYQVLLDAEAHLRMYEMSPVDVLFVVDQSNSMLFPSGLTPINKTVTLDKRGYYNNNNMTNLRLDPNQVYYIISDPHGTSTVWALFTDEEIDRQTGQQIWYYQDASYYAKAKHNNGNGYKDPSEKAVIPTDRSYKDQIDYQGSGNRANGGGLSKSMDGSGLYNYINQMGDTHTFEIYVASDPYNRLHYLEEAMTNMIYELANANKENRVTLIGFTKELRSWTLPGSNTAVEEGPYMLTPENTAMLASLVSNINTGGGTRQDVGLKQAYEGHLNNWRKNYNKGVNYTHTILITDGAPVRSGSDAPQLGDAYGRGESTASGGTIYDQIRGWARQVRGKSTLMTVGLGMGEVDGGSAVLEQIPSNNAYCALDDAAQLVAEMQKLLFESFRPVDTDLTLYGQVTDEISDSFYPIAWVDEGAGEATGRALSVQAEGRDWVLLQAGDWINLQGKYVAAGSSDAAGQVLQKDDGTYCVQWNPVVLNYGWHGTVYVKAKEDFIGGNAIDTNKEAYASILDGQIILGKQPFETPTVNVRLLDMNQNNSETTIYLGTLVNRAGDAPVDSLRSFYDETRFTKLITDGGDVLNKVTAAASETDGLEEAVFYLRYALGRDLTDEEWTRLMNGETLEVEYTYDHASSHGAVGSFRFRLEKNGMEGAQPEYGPHTAKAACQPDGVPATDACDQPAETYTLHVTYNAYLLGQKGRPAANKHNGSGSPGTQVGTGDTVETGLGTLVKKNVHEVHVISGRIEIIKEFAAGYTAPADTTFTFILHPTGDGDDHSNDQTAAITIPAGSSVGTASAVFSSLPYGEYVVSEAADEVYRVKELEILGDTNCYAAAAETTATFFMGRNTANGEVIGVKNPSDRYTAYIDPVNGVYGGVIFTNEEIVYEGEVPVRKVWSDGAENHTADAVYMLLYLDDSPVLDGDGRGQLLRLDASNDWQGSFTVVLADKYDTVENYDYSVREVSEVSAASKLNWLTAVLQNDDTEVYYEKALADGDVLSIGSRAYIVSYEGMDSHEIIVENHRAVELPNTGGSGTQMYQYSGLLLLAAALVYGCALRRGRRKGAEG